MSDDKGRLIYDQDMFSLTAKEIEKADPEGQYGPIGDFSEYSGSRESSHVRPGDLTIAKLENPGVDGLVPDSSRDPWANNSKGFALYDPTSQFNNNGSLWDGDETYTGLEQPAVADLISSYNNFIDAFYNAQSQMSRELHETAANIRRMATVYEATEDANERDIFGISLPAPYNALGH